MKLQQRLRRLVLALAPLAAFATAGAQQQRTVDGRVVRPFVPPRTAGTPTAQADTIALATVPNVVVTLHRVGKDGNGPLDSVRTNGKGEYKFSFRTSGASDAIYFTSVTWGGITYFTPPLRSVAARDQDAEVAVFDTTSRAFPLTVSGRHVIVSAADTNSERTIIEVFEISNDSTLTLVSGNPKTGAPTFSVSIPAEARDVKVGQGQVSAQAFTASGGRASMFSPIAPGLTQLSFSYRLPGKSFPRTIEIDHGATVLEVLLEEALGKATAEGLVASDPVALENRQFRRFLGQDVKDGTLLTLDLSSGPSVGRNLYIAALLGTIGVVMLLILLRAMQRRRPITYGGPPINRRVADAPLADKLAREIADLDATYAKHDNPAESLRAAYAARRAELKDALAAELARH